MMKRFECINTFTAQEGSFYPKGAIIYEGEFDSLSALDKPYFKQLPSAKDDNQPWQKSIILTSHTQYQEDSHDIDQMYGGILEEEDIWIAGASDDF